MRPWVEDSLLGVVRDLSGLERLIGVVLVVFAIALFVRLQTVALRLREDEAKSRWASNLRDLVNLLAAFILFAAFWTCGLPLAASLLFSGTVTVLLDVARHWGRTPDERARLSLITGLVTSLPVALFTGPILAGTNRLVGVLF